jgi:histidine triad (HIT) family protein
MESCIFCKVVRRELPADVVHEDDSVVAFRDIHPQAPVHLLICPKKHIPTLNDILPEHDALIAHMFTVARLLAKQNGIDQRGYRTVFNVNAEAGQTVFHMHLHVIGGRQLSWP